MAIPKPVETTKKPPPAWEESEEAQVSLVIVTGDGAYYAFPYMSLSHIEARSSDLVIFMGSAKICVTLINDLYVVTTLLYLLADNKVREIVASENMCEISVEFPKEDE